MFTLTKKFDNLIEFVRDKCDKYVYSFFVPLLTSFLVLLFWFANWQIVGFSIVILFCCFTLIFYDDFLPLVPLMLILPMCFRDSTNAFANNSAFFIVLFALLAIAIVFHLIKYPMKNIKLDGFFFFLVVLNIVLLISGIFSNNSKNYFKAMDIYLISGVMPLAVHLFFYNKVNLSKKVNHRKYLCTAFIIAITVACVQLCYARLIDFYFGKHFWTPHLPNFCWANTNNIGNLILLAVPLCCYLMLSSKHVWAWMLEILFFYCAMFVSGSDGALAALLVCTPFLMFFVYKNCFRENFNFIKTTFFSITAIIVIVVVGVVLFDTAFLLTFLEESSSGSGRIWAYELAISDFLEYPIFGIGLGGGRASLDAIAKTHNYHGFYHSTFFHILACGGIIGIITYVAYYVVRIKYILKNGSLLGESVFYAFVMFGIYGMIDTGEFNIVLLFMTTLITIVGLLNKNGSDDKPLPLFVKIPKFN